MFAGTHTAVVTPFTSDDKIDEAAYLRIIETQWSGGVKGIVPAGTTGESATLDYEEHHRVIELAVEATRKRGLVIAGTGSNSTREAVKMTQAAEAAGADATLQVTPYYNKPSQEGLFQHFRAIADSTSLPIMLYSIPGRCHVEIEVGTAVRLAEACANIFSIKEAGGKTERVSLLRKELPDTFEILSGDDALTVPFMELGAVGVVSVAGNLIPKVMADLVQLGLAGDFQGAKALQDQYWPLFKAFLTLDTNPVPVKAAMELAGLCRADLRLPMTRMNRENTDRLREVLRDCGLLA